MTGTRRATHALLLISLTVLACARQMSQESRPGAGSTAGVDKKAPRPLRQGGSDPRLAVLPTEG
jgi:hypothetical protein